MFTLLQLAFFPSCMIFLLIVYKSVCPTKLTAWWKYTLGEKKKKKEVDQSLNKCTLKKKFTYHTCGWQQLSGQLILYLKPESDTYGISKNFLFHEWFFLMEKSLLLPYIHVFLPFCNEFRNMRRQPFILKEVKVEKLAFILQNKLLKRKSKLSVKQKMPYHFSSVSSYFIGVILISHYLSMFWLYWQTKREFLKFTRGRIK